VDGTSESALIIDIEPLAAGLRHSTMDSLLTVDDIQVGLTRGAVGTSLAPSQGRANEGPGESPNTLSSSSWFYRPDDGERTAQRASAAKLKICI
jgi:hypothetical protein